MALINTTTTGVLGSTFYGDGSGNLTVQKDGVTQGIYGNIPAFSAYQINGSANQSISSDVWTKAKLDTEEFDTNNNFDTTNNRFLPTIAGYYQINACLYLRNAASCPIKIVSLYKNGSIYKQGMQLYFNGNYYIAADTFPVSSIMYLNGTTDYVELYGYISSSSASIGYGSTATWMNGHLVKAA